MLKELFVGPAFRRRGYATLIEGQAAAIARTWRSARMDVYLHSADALIGNRVAVRVFGLRAGYQWRWRQATLPNLGAIGEKTPYENAAVAGDAGDSSSQCPSPTAR